MTALMVCMRFSASSKTMLFSLSKTSSVTMLDVAKHAGVALGTVSKVVNKQPVRSPYKEKVEEAIRELGYQLNTNGRVLRTQKTMTIAYFQTAPG